MTIRVAMLAAECEPWAKTAASPTSWTRSRARSAGCRRPARSSPRRSTSSSRATGPSPSRRERARAGARIADPRGGAPLEVGDRRRRRRRLPAPAGRLPAAFDRDAFYDFPDDPWRFAVFNRAALAALERDGAPIDVLHVHDWHTGPAAHRAGPRRGRDNPFFPGMAAWSRSTTSPTTAGRRATARPARARGRGPSAAPTPTASTCCSRDRGRRDGQHRLAGVRRANR